jgi:hypothetical protein
VIVNAAAAMLWFRNELNPLGVADQQSRITVPVSMVLVHLFFLVSVVLFAHHATVFIALLMFFLGFASAYKQYQNPLILREAFLVAFFLGGLVVLGGFQQW